MNKFRFVALVPVRMTGIDWTKKRNRKNKTKTQGNKAKQRNERWRGRGGKKKKPKRALTRFKRRPRRLKISPIAVHEGEFQLTFRAFRPKLIPQIASRPQEAAKRPKRDPKRPHKQPPRSPKRFQN